MKPWLFGGGLVCGLLMVLLAGLAAVSLWGGTAGGTLPSGRGISARSDRLDLHCEMQTDTARITSGGKTVLITPEGLEVDGQFAAPLPREAREVSVSLRRGQVHVVADGATVLTTRR